MFHGVRTSLSGQVLATKACHCRITASCCIDDCTCKIRCRCALLSRRVLLSARRVKGVEADAWCCTRCLSSINLRNSCKEPRLPQHDSHSICLSHRYSILVRILTIQVCQCHATRGAEWWVRGEESRMKTGFRTVPIQGAHARKD